MLLIWLEVNNQMKEKQEVEKKKNKRERENNEKKKMSRKQFYFKYPMAYCLRE